MGWEERGILPLLLEDLEKYTLSFTTYYTCIITTIFKLPTSTASL